MTQLLSFLQELLQRIKTANPPFFKKLQILFSIIALVSGFGIVLEWNISALNWLFDWTWFGFFAGSVVASQLPNKDNIRVKTSDEGEDFSDPNKPRPDKL
jgi:hypothetical protein